MSASMSLRSSLRAPKTPLLFRRNLSNSRPVSAKQQVRIVEVGPRDGLQNEKKSIPVETKIELVRLLASTGINTIEAGSFVHPKWVPQMASSDSILEHVLRDTPQATSTKSMRYQWLLPNVKGLENFLATYDKQSSNSSSSTSGYPTPPSTPTNDGGPALNTSSADANAMPSSTSGVDAMSQSGAPSSSPMMERSPALNTSSADANAMPSSTSGVDSTSTSSSSKQEVSIFMAATESFSQKNTNCSIAESLARFAPLMQQARSRSFAVRAYISVALGCPYEGPDVDPHRVAELAAELLEMGADEVSIADTTGMGTAPRTANLLKTLQAAGIRNEDLALHFHDTYGQALVNTLVGLEHGVTVFDSAVGGLGGCPYSPGATGNVATEDMVHMLHSLGAETGVDLQKVAEVGDWISAELGRPNESRAGKATLAKLRAAA